jgi:hypothetical protein
VGIGEPPAPRYAEACPTHSPPPNPDAHHAKLALEQLSRETPADQRAIKRAVGKRFPAALKAYEAKHAAAAARHKRA